jgi:hypothetical protein
VFTILKRQPTAQKQPRYTNMRDASTGNSQPVRIKTLVHIQPAMAGPDVDGLLVIGQVELRELAKEDDDAAVVACEGRVVQAPTAAHGECCADEAG